MEKEFIPYEQALALKELGFNEPCLATTDQTDYIHIKGTKSSPRGSMMYDIIDCPLYQQSFRWFREKYDLVIEISVTDIKLKYEINIFSKVVKRQLLVRTTYEDIFQYQFETYEEAELECLKKLIEIVKTEMESTNDLL